MIAFAYILESSLKDLLLNLQHVWPYQKVLALNYFFPLQAGTAFEVEERETIWYARA